MRTLYQFLVFTFILGIISSILFLVFYMQGFSALFGGWNNMINIDEAEPPFGGPDELFNFLFSPKIIISFLVMLISGIGNMILGIVLIARNRFVKSDAKVLWILGFIILPFVTNIVFFALKKSHNLLGDAPVNSNEFDFEKR